MPRKFLRRIIPDHKTIRENRHLQRFGQRLAEPKLWHLNRYSVAGGLALGIFVGFMPVLGQMFIAAGLAILLRVNLPVASMAVWFSNPLTVAPLYYFAYRVGAWILQLPVGNHTFILSWEWLTSGFLLIWQPFLLGCIVCGGVAALIAILATRLVWRLLVIRSWLKRRKKTDTKP